eukprot:6183898-Pleurochrysis_carterae.AAC.4
MRVGTPATKTHPKRFSAQSSLFVVRFMRNRLLSDPGLLSESPACCFPIVRRWRPTARKAPAARNSSDTRFHALKPVRVLHSAERDLYPRLPGLCGRRKLPFEAVPLDAMTRQYQLPR